MVTKKILEKEIEISRSRIENEERLENGIENAFADGEITYEEFKIDLEDIQNNIYELQKNIIIYEYLIEKYCKNEP